MCEPETEESESNEQEQQPEMTDNLDVAKLAVELSKKSFERFKDRRSYEWKITFGIWAAQGAFFYKVYDKPFRFFGEHLEFNVDLCTSFTNVLCFVVIILVCWIPVLIHWFFHTWIQKEHGIDARTAYLYELQAVGLVNKLEDTSTKLVVPNVFLEEKADQMKKTNEILGDLNEDEDIKEQFEKFQKYLGQRGWRKPANMQIAVTVLIGFVTAFWLK